MLSNEQSKTLMCNLMRFKLKARKNHISDVLFIFNIIDIFDRKKLRIEDDT